MRYVAGNHDTMTAAYEKYLSLICFTLKVNEATFIWEERVRTIFVPDVELSGEKI